MPQSPADRAISWSRASQVADSTTGEEWPPDYEACGLMLHALEISRANLKNFAAERRDHARSSNTQPAAKEKREERRREKKGPRIWIN